MSMNWKMKQKLMLFALCTGLIPLIIASFFMVATSGSIIKKQAIQYLQVRVDDFAKTAELRYAGIQGNLDLIKAELERALMADLIKEASNERYFKTGYMVLVRSDGMVLYHPKKEFSNNKYLYETFDWAHKAVNMKKGLFEYTLKGERKISYLTYIKPLDLVLWAGIPESEILSEVTAMEYKIFAFIAIVCIIVALIGGIIATRMANMARNISVKMDDIAQGEADLTVRLPITSSDEIGDIAQDFNRFVSNLEEVITQVKNTAAQVDTATQEVSAGSQGLSQATQEQASAIEEVAATIEEMSSSIKNTAESSSNGRLKVSEMVRMADASGTAAHELVHSMTEISEASRKIGDIITTVNEVAFQTNLLALNAAVEAARAGEHGKGFAVVAEEVRALAQRSANASREIKSLIEDTVNKIAAGDSMVKKSGELLDEIIRHIQDLSLVMEEIAAASGEQASGVDELNRAVSQIDSTTQQNASTVEELASISDSLRNEARQLAEVVGRFKVSTIQRGIEAPSGKKPATKIVPMRRAAPRFGPAKDTKVASSSDDISDFEEF